MRQRLADVGRGLVALGLLLLLVVGIPVGLAVAVGWPLPSGVPTTDAVREALTRRGIDDMVVVKTLALLLWMTWAQVVMSFLVEIAALVRGRSPGRAPALPAVQLIVARLVATAALAASIAGAPRNEAPLSPRPISATAVAFAPAATPAPAVLAAPGTARAPDDSKSYRVRRHDSLWSIAEGVLGDGFRWQEIRDLNVGRTMLDGTVVTSTTETIEPGWVLLLPSDARVESAPAPSDVGGVVMVQPGEHLWSIAEDTLADSLGREPADEEVAPRWQQIIDANRLQLVDPSNPGLVFAGQSIVIPGAPASVEPAPEPPHVEVPAPPPAAEPAHASSTTVASPPPPDQGSARATVDGDEVSEQEQRSAPTGMFGVAGATIAAGLGAALLRRRRRRLLHVPTGSMPAPPPPELDDIRRDLVLAADEDQVASLRNTITELAGALATARSSARPRLVQADGHRIEVLLTSTVLPAPDGWRAEGGGTVWASDGRASEPSNDLDAPTPTVLVAIGAPEDAGQLYLDLEAEAVVSLSGERKAVRELVTSMVLELANSPLSEGVHTVAVGLDDVGALEECEGIQVVHCWTDVADDVLARAEQSHELLAANRWPNAFVSRAKSGWRDDLMPVVVLLAEAPTADERFERVCQLVNTGATTVSIVVAAEAPYSTRIELDGDLLRMPSLGVTCRAQAVDSVTASRVAEVLVDADHLPAQLPLIDDEQCARASLGYVATGEEPEILVRVLGEIDIVGGRRPLTPKQTAVVTYIALHAPVAAERIEDAIWTEPTSSRRKRMSNTVSDCRFSLGEQHLPLAQEGRYTIGPKVATDLTLFDRRVTYAASRAPSEAVGLLREALELVRGPVFTYRSLDRQSYVWIDIENWMTTWELKVAATAIRLNELALELGATETAIWAAERGLLTLPTNSPLTEALMKAYRAGGDGEAAQKVYERHVAALEQLGIDDIAEAMIDLRDEVRQPRPVTESA